MPDSQVGRPLPVFRFALLISTWATNLAWGQASQPLAVITHPSTSVSDLSLEELRRLYLGTTTTLANQVRVVLVESGDQRVRFYSEALGMSEERFKRHWIARAFAGEPGTPPEEIREPAELLRYVGRHPGAVGFIPANHVDGSVKLLTIETLRPSDPRYPLP